MTKDHRYMSLFILLRQIVVLDERHPFMNSKSKIQYIYFFSEIKWSHKIKEKKNNWQSFSQFIWGKKISVCFSTNNEHLQMWWNIQPRRLALRSKILGTTQYASISLNVSLLHLSIEWNPLVHLPCLISIPSTRAVYCLCSLTYPCNMPL